MNRRDWMKTAAVAAAAAAVPFELEAQKPKTASGRAKIETEIKRLKLRHTWTTTMSSSDYRDTLHLRYTRDGVTGIGEGAPIVRYNEDAVGCDKAVKSVLEFLETSNPWTYDKLERELLKRVKGNWAGKAAFDIALLDWLGQKLGIPIYRFFGLDAADAPVTTFSIGIDTPEITRQKVREAEAFPVLKIKVGLASDEPTIEAVRSVTKKPLRVDANEGWKTKEEAVAKINWLESQGVEMVEQPMAADLIEEHRWIRSRIHIPMLADEAVHHPSDIPKLRDAFDGVNIKLDKTGGIVEAYRCLQMAKALGMKTMLGCMISSSASVTAAAHLSPLVDYADLDGNLLIGNDPYQGVTVKDGKLVLPDKPGLGLTMA